MRRERGCEPGEGRRQLHGGNRGKRNGKQGQGGDCEGCARTESQEEGSDQVGGFWETPTAPVDYRHEKQKNAKVGGFWETRAAPVDYRQEKQKNAKVSDWVFLGFSLL
ncbi:hypothetical protein NDU88_003833 [Pleurodeles waltl]|uniref:Uncharacterized protein n=1 Tax=Pleurodeles waltl TaxID=8319 RepID=A0AAV7SH17_PLEWA|nr:hypothetical protein NDU88_003833 [Pleurodeles waltl]